MTRILLASHAGESSAGAVRIAPLVAERLGAELAAVSVLPSVQPLDYGFGVVYAGSPEVETALARKLGAEVDAQFTRFGVGGCMPTVRIGHPAMEIASAARTVNASLIVVGLGPHRVLDRALGGETALQLVQVASTPVFAVRADATALPRRIVVGVDFTPSSILAARTAARLLATGDVLHLVHAGGEPPDARAALTGDAHRHEVPLDAGTRLAALPASLGVPDGVTVHHSLIEGVPAQALLDVLARVQGDLIAVGSHGYGLWKRLTIGSVASKILRLSQTSVLVQPIGSVTAAASGPPPAS